jgi:hypothetical protein
MLEAGDGSKPFDSFRQKIRDPSKIGMRWRYAGWRKVNRYLFVSVPHCGNMRRAT